MASDTKDSRPSHKRQTPVNCKFCRVRKLKCTRTFPCGQCSARGVQCVFEPTSQAARTAQDGEPSNAAILNRLQRLEDMIVRLGQGLPQTPDSGINRGADPSASTLTPDEVSHHLESQDLQSIGTSQPTLFPAVSFHFVFEPVPLDSLATFRHTSAHGSNTMNIDVRCVYVPMYDDACILFDRYATHVSHFHYIVHLPTLRKVMETFYLNLSRQEPVDIDHAALLLATWCTVYCYARHYDDEPPSFKSGSESEKIFDMLFRSVLDLLDHSRRVLPGSVEIVQACIMVVFLEYNLEGFSTRARMILAQALNSAREQGLHRIDAPSIVRRRERTLSTASLIDIEIQRRMWWHLVATDWMVSLAGSAQEGTYSAHPQQMRVRLPRNIDDDALDRGNTTEDQPLTSPTPMCYPLHRIKLGEISRSVVDTFRVGLCEPNECDYASIMVLDRRIEGFLNELPVFLKLDSDSLAESRPVLDQYPFFAMQRYIINIGARSIRCKLHQPFLVKSKGKPQDNRSVEICLTSAMEVLDINRSIREDASHAIPAKVKLTGMLHHMFLATVVLVMDLCFNRSPNGVNDSRGSEVANALRMLEEAKHESVSVQKFLDSLRDALSKHHIRLQDDEHMVAGDEGRTRSQQSSTQTWLEITTGQTPASGVSEGLGFNATQTTTLGFEDFWRDQIQNGDLPSLPDWDQLFSDLDAFIA